MNDDVYIIDEWLRFANMDLDAAKFSFKTMPPAPLEIICFHCQQAAEAFSPPGPRCPHLAHQPDGASGRYVPEPAGHRRGRCRSHLAVAQQQTGQVSLPISIPTGQLPPPVAPPAHASQESGRSRRPSLLGGCCRAAL